MFWSPYVSFFDLFLTFKIKDCFEGVTVLIEPVISLYVWVAVGKSEPLNLVTGPLSRRSVLVYVKNIPTSVIVCHLSCKTDRNSC